MEKNNNNIYIPKEGGLVKITARHCGEKVSPLLQVGMTYTVRAVASLNDGTPVLELEHPTRKNAVLRANASRFDWEQAGTPESPAQAEQSATKDSIPSDKQESIARPLPDGITPQSIPMNPLSASRFAQEPRGISRDVMLSEALTLRESMQMVYMPLILSQLAWVYADKAVKICVANKIGDMRGVTKGLRTQRADFEKKFVRAYGYGSLKRIECLVKRFMTEYEYNLSILYFSVLREVQKRMPETDIADMRAYAVISMLVIQALYGHNRRMDELILARTGRKSFTRKPQAMDALYACMDAYASLPPDFDYSNPDITASMKIINIKLNAIEFEVK